MNNSQEYMLLIILGFMLIAIPVVKATLEKAGIPALVGFLGLGFFTRLIDHSFPFITSNLQQVIAFLAHIGIFMLLFQVGLKSNIKGLIKKLPDASLIWLGDVVVNFSLGYLAARYLIHLPLISSLVIATALTATSVAVSIVVWQEKNKINTARGQLLIDVAELDDLSGILILVALLAIIPVLQSGDGNILSILGTTISIMIAKLILFIGFCYWFSHYLEQSFTQFNLQWVDSRIGLTISILGVGLAIAAFAGYVGFSMAIGALFAGLAFSRDHLAVKSNTRIMTLYEFFVPFFFIHIGMEVDPNAIFQSLDLAILITLIAVIGKVAGVGLPALIHSNRQNALLLGISMVPRAEIAMLIVFQASLLDKNIISSELYAAMVLVAVLTSVTSPIILRKLIKD